MRKKVLVVLLAELLLIMVTGCSESTPTGELVDRAPSTGMQAHESDLQAGILSINSL